MDHIGKDTQVFKQIQRPCTMRIDTSASGEPEIVICGDGSAYSFVIPMYTIQSVIDRLCAIRDSYDERRS